MTQTGTGIPTTDTGRPAKRMLPVVQPDHERRVSPDWVRISTASALALRFRSGRFTRDFDFGGINLLLNYGSGCRSDCSYCGLARTRPGQYEEKSFIRVEWPLVETDDLVGRMRRFEATLTRLCISMVTHGRAYPDTCEITRRIRARVATPLSILLAPPSMNRQRLEHFRELGVDMIGIGLDAATEGLFRRHRTDVPSGGGLSWAKYWEVVEDSRDLFGPWKVNCHVLVGLGETDRELVELFVALCEREIYPYLFCFNPEPASRLAEQPKAPLTRWRRIQLAKHLVEVEGWRVDSFDFDDEGSLVQLRATDAARDVPYRAAATGTPFMTDGCPGPGGEPGCTRPYGSYGPGEAFRDFPFLPEGDDMDSIMAELRLDELGG